MWSVLFILFGILQLLDIYSTIKVLNAGGREANPVIKFFMDKFGKLWIPLKLALAGIPAYYLYVNMVNPLGLAVIMLMILVYLWVINHNLKVYKRIK